MSDIEIQRRSSICQACGTLISNGTLMICMDCFDVEADIDCEEFIKLAELIITELEEEENTK